MKKKIQEVFTSGFRVFDGPLSAVILVEKNPEELLPHQPILAGFTVSKRYHKKAVSRNRIKRLLREAYRVNNSPIKSLIADKSCTVSCMFIWQSKELPIYQELEAAVSNILTRLGKKLLLTK